MPTLKRIHDTADTLFVLASALHDERLRADAATLLAASRILRRRFAPGQRCPGRMWNGPGKEWSRCAVCGRLDYETNEGDPCPYDTTEEDPAS